MMDASRFSARLERALAALTPNANPPPTCGVPAPPHRAGAETAHARRAVALGASLGGVGERLDAEEALLRLGVAK